MEPSADAHGQLVRGRLAMDRLLWLANEPTVSLARHPLVRFRAWWNGGSVIEAVRLLGEGQEVILLVSSFAEVVAATPELRTSVEQYVADPEARSFYITAIEAVQRRGREAQRSAGVTDETVA